MRRYVTAHAYRRGCAKINGRCDVVGFYASHSTRLHMNGHMSTSTVAEETEAETCQVW